MARKRSPVRSRLGPLESRLRAAFALRGLVRRRPHNRPAVRPLHDERQHAVGAVRLDRADRVVEQPLALVGGEPHVQARTVRRCRPSRPSAHARRAPRSSRCRCPGGARRSRSSQPPPGSLPRSASSMHASAASAGRAPGAERARAAARRAPRAGARAGRSSRTGLAATSPPLSGSAATSLPSRSATTSRPKGTGTSDSAARRSIAGSSAGLHIRSSMSGDSTRDRLRPACAAGPSDAGSRSGLP